MSDDKEIRGDAKLKNLSAEDLDVLWSWRYPEEPEDKKLYREIQVELPLQFGLTASVSTLSDFYGWLKQRKRMESAKARAEQAKLQLLEQNPDASLADLERIGQMVFTSETVADGDIKGFVALLKINKENRKLELEERRVKLLEEKAAEAKAILENVATAAKGGGVTEETIRKIEEAAGLL